MKVSVTINSETAKAIDEIVAARNSQREFVIQRLLEEALYNEEEGIEGLTKQWLQSTALDVSELCLNIFSYAAAGEYVLHDARELLHLLKSLDFKNQVMITGDEENLEELRKAIANVAAALEDKRTKFRAGDEDLVYENDVRLLRNEGLDPRWFNGNPTAGMIIGILSRYWDYTIYDKDNDGYVNLGDYKWTYIILTELARLAHWSSTSASRVDLMRAIKRLSVETTTY